MTVSIQQAMDEPIVSFIFEGRLDEQTVSAVNAHVHELLGTLGGFYAIVDIRGQEVTFGEMIALFENARDPGIFANLHVTPVFVSEHEMPDPTNQKQVPVFKDREAATDYIHQLIAGS
jgi:hypothetical protein